jgi:hypothetical protein
VEKAREKSERDAHLKDEGGIRLFEQLRLWMGGQAKSFSGTTPTQAFEVGEIKQFGGPDCHHFFQVSDTNRRRLSMKISYRSAPHGITVEQHGDIPKHYSLAVGDNDSLFFEARDGQSKNIEQLGSELLDSWRGAPM